LTVFDGVSPLLVFFTNKLPHSILVTKLTTALEGLNIITMVVGHFQALSAVLSPERVAYFYSFTLLHPFRAYPL
jgi:hypothetical protein